jgi:primosomal protein N' (replication factor Y)
MQTLFPQLPPVPFADGDEPPHVGPVASIALERGIDRVLDYAIPVKLQSTLRIGMRVRVPLGRGNKSATGYVVGLPEKVSTTKRIKPIGELLDDRELVAPPLMGLARWISRYYVCPLGIVLDSVVPSAVKNQIGLDYTSMVRPVVPRDQLQNLLEACKAPKRRSVLGRLLQLPDGEAIDLIRLAGDAGVVPTTVRKLVKLGVISIDHQPDLGAGDNDVWPTPSDEPDRVLNAEQQAVFDQLRPRMPQKKLATDGAQMHTDAEGIFNAQSSSVSICAPSVANSSGIGVPSVADSPGFSVNLLWGVTGSGKTEIYLQCIREVVAAGRQAIVLVPEIALTPQTVKRFVARFPRVAVLHSGLTAGQRHRHWQRIARGRADVVIGARSAVFAPVPHLGLIVVDEEHEASYKQDSAPRYHGRDVAIKRAQSENVPVLLGSATPSLEMYHRVSVVRGPLSVVETGATSEAANHDGADVARRTTDNGQRTTDIYHLLRLPTRVREIKMPAVELLDMREENKSRRGVHLLSRRLEALLKVTVDSGRQAILLLNRRGYSNFIYCPSCGEAIQCKYCDTTMTYHRSAGETPLTARSEAGVHTGQMHCHYCMAVNQLPQACPVCSKKLSLFGLGTQRVEEELKRKFPELNFARVDSDSMRGSKDYEAILGKFARNEIQVMLGTQMIAKGLDYPNVTLVGVISGDTALALPDFRAAERTFQLITQVAGRAGRGDAPGRVVLQTFLPDDPTIGFALKHDYAGFAAAEMKLRAEVGLPPFARMVRIILRDQEAEKVHRLSEDVAAAIHRAIAASGQSGRITVKGPMPCPISRIAGYFRDQIVMISPRGESLQKALAEARREQVLAKNDRIAVDVDPVSLL